MSKIYVVKASVGEYSDRVEHTVAAYTNEEDAKQHVLKGEEQSRLAKQDERYREEGEIDDRFLVFAPDLSPYDYWYKTPTYYYTPVELDADHFMTLLRGQ